MNEIFMRVTTFAESGAFHPFNCRKQRQRDVWIIKKKTQLMKLKAKAI